MGICISSYESGHIYIYIYIFYIRWVNYESRYSLKLQYFETKRVDGKRKIRINLLAKTAFLAINVHHSTCLGS